LNAPAAVTAQWNNDKSNDAPASFTVTVKPNSIASIPSYPLHGYRLSWELYEDAKLLSHGEQNFTDLNAAESVSGNIEGKPHKLQLHLSLVRPTGEVAAEKNLDWNAGRQQAKQTDNAADPTQ